MLKTNSKKAKENIINYIINNFDGTNYTDAPPQRWHDIATYIIDTFKSEKYNCKQDYCYYKYNEAAAFFDWCAGLPSILDTCYFYNRSATEDLAGILEESQTEKEKYTEADAEKLLTYLIYKTLIKEVNKK